MLCAYLITRLTFRYKFVADFYSGMAKIFDEIRRVEAKQISNLVGVCGKNCPLNEVK